MKIPQEIIVTELDKCLKRQNKSQDELCFIYEEPIPDRCHEGIMKRKRKYGININHESQDHASVDCYPLVVVVKWLIKHSSDRATCALEQKLLPLFAFVYTALPYVTKY